LPAKRVPFDYGQYADEKHPNRERHVLGYLQLGSGRGTLTVSNAMVAAT
jgi:hypothetical protein